MNCLEFRRRSLADPFAAGAPEQAHLAECSACRAYHQQALQWESQLADALDVDVPVGLEQRILERRQPAATANSAGPRRWAIAATVTLAVVLGAGGAWRATSPNPALLAASIAHVDGEPVAMTAAQNVPAAQVAMAVSMSGAEMTGPLKVSYLNDCPVPGGWGKHMVVDTPAGKVTLITMPNQHVFRRMERDSGPRAVAVFPANIGSVAIIADNAGQLNAAEQMLAKNIVWRS